MKQLYNEIMHSKDTDGMADSVNPDQTVPNNQTGIKGHDQVTLGLV